MGKKLLFTLLAFILPVAAALADNVMIDVDNAANVEVTYGSGTPLSLESGMNRITTLTSADNPLTIRPASGATIESVTLNNSETLSPSGDGAYRVAISNMMLQIVTSGSGSPSVPKYNTYFSTPPESFGTFCFKYDDVTTVVDAGIYYQLPAQEITLAPMEGYMLNNVVYDPMWTGNQAKQNEDGTWTFTPVFEAGRVEVSVVEAGIPFNLEIGLKENVQIVAWLDQDCDWETSKYKILEPKGYGPSYTCVAPEGTYALDFYPVEGGEIKSIFRKNAYGVKTELTKSDYSGWRTSLSEGETYIIDAQGPEVDLMVLSGTQEIKSDQFVVSIDGTVIPFTDGNTSIKAHAGDIVTVSGAKGVLLTALTPDCGETVQGWSPVQTFQITKSGLLLCYGRALEGEVIYVNNANAVVVTDRAGYGSKLTLEDAENFMESVNNPLSIAAADGYLIKSVILNGETLEENANGTYTAEVTEGSALVITTAEKPSAYAITVGVAGEYEWLTVTNDGEAVTLTAEANTIQALPGSLLTFAPVKGYLVDSFSADGQLTVNKVEDTDLWTVYVNGPGSISVEMHKWVAAENNVLIDYSVNDGFYAPAAVVLDQNGNWYATLNRGLNEIPKGMSIDLSFSGGFILAEVLYNGKPMQTSDDNRDCRFTVEEEGDVKVAVSRDGLVYVAGWTTVDNVNHAIIGDVNINKLGQTSYYGKAGETITLIPVASPGYKFAGFTYTFPEEILPLISKEEPYTVTIPEDVTSFAVQASFVKDEEHPSYLIHTYQCYLNGYEVSNLSSSAFVMMLLPDGTETNDALVEEGQTVHFLCYVANEMMQCEHFCLYTSPRTVIAQDYVVNGADANVEGTIEISAVVTVGNAVEGVDAEKTGYDKASCTLTVEEPARIYTMSGQLVKTVEAGSTDLSDLAEGMYVVVTPSSSMKIAR